MLVAPSTSWMVQHHKFPQHSPRLSPCVQPVDTRTLPEAPGPEVCDQGTSTLATVLTPDHGQTGVNRGVYLASLHYRERLDRSIIEKCLVTE